MTEPIATPICTAALITAGAACTFLGLDAEALIWGFAGGLIAQSYLPARAEDGAPVAAWRAFLMLAGGAVMAAALVPFAPGLLEKIGITAVGGARAVKVAGAVVLGIVAPVLPGLLRKLAGKAGGG